MELYDPEKHRAKIEEIDIDDDQQLEREVKDLLDWSDNLDYAEYAKYWFTLSTSEPSNKFAHSTMKESKTKPVFLT